MIEKVKTLEFQNQKLNDRIAELINEKSEPVEDLAKQLHEAGREAVLKNKVVKKDGAPLGEIKFLEWSEITEDAREGRRMQVRKMLEKYIIKKKAK